MIELIDLVDDSGVIVKRGVARNDTTEIDGLHKQIVIVVIFNNLGEVLVHERSMKKSVLGGYVDLICGAIISGETPLDAAIRESKEEGGIAPVNLKVVRKGLNPYGHYCYLLRGESDERPGTDLDPNEVAWAAFKGIDELKQANRTKELNFVDGFFEDIEAALNS